MEIGENVVCLLAAYAKERGRTIDTAANEVLAHFLYQGATLAA